MRSSGTAKGWLILCLSVVFIQIAKAQDPEKTKADIIYTMMDLDYKIAYIPTTKDTSCRGFYAVQAKAEYAKFKQLLEPNLALFKPGQQTRLTNYQKALEELFTSETVFAVLKKPNYAISKSVEDPEAAVKLSDRIHGMARNLLIDNIENIWHLDLALQLSKLSAAADIITMQSPSSDCKTAALKQLDTETASLEKLYQAGKANSKPEVNSLIEKLIIACKNKAGDLSQQTAILYSSGFLKLTPGGKVAAKENKRVEKEELQKREVKLKMLYPTTKVYLDAKVKSLKETDKYAVILPGIADTWAGQHAIYFNSAAKPVKKGETPDYTFKIIAPGVKDFIIAKPQYANGTVKANIMFHPTIEVHGFFADIFYRFPLKIEVWNKAGELEKTIVVFDETKLLGDMYHADYLRPQTSEELNSVATIKPFADESSATNSIEKEKDNIIKRLQQNTWIVLADYISKALTTAYGSDKLSNQMYPIYGIKDNNPEQVALTALVEKTKEAISNIGDKEKAASSIAALKSIVSEYEQRLMVADITPNMKALCLINASQAALLSDQINKSVDFYKAYLEVEKDNMGMQMSYEKMLPSYYYRGVMADGTVNPIVLQEPPAKFKK